MEGVLLSVQIRFPKETKWLYPQNQSFAEALLGGKKAEPVHQREIQANFDKLEFDFLTAPWIIGYGLVGLIGIATAIGIVLWVVWAFSQPELVAKLNPFAYGNRFRDNWLLASIGGFIVSLPMGIGFLRWALRAYPYLKYPTSGERHYYQLLDKGRIHMARVERLENIEDNKTRIKFSLKNGRAVGTYLTASSIAKTLKEKDKIVLFSQGDYDVLL
jgi:NADH:ubiquinone oxidoreductase subunit D